MNIKNSKHLLFVLILVGLMAILQINSASADIVDRPRFSTKTVCQADGGSWSGNNDNFGTCTYPANGAFAIQHCGDDHTYTVTANLDESTDTSCSLIAGSTTTSSNEPPIEYEEKCKLIEIDPILHVGGTFNAKWIGLMTSIRFRQPLGGLQFITMIPGTLTYEQVHPDHQYMHYSAYFQNGFLIDRGRWQASCWGPEGTFGAPIIINVH